MSFNLQDFIQRCENSLSQSNPMQAVKSVMSDAMVDLDSVTNLLPPDGEDEILLHRTPSITIYRVMVRHGLEYPPHEHGMPVIIGPYFGCETNFLYRRRSDDPSLIEKTGRIDIKAPEVVAFGAEVVHSVTNFAKEPSAAIHVYLGDLSAQSRSLWTLDLNDECIFDEGSYFARAMESVNARSLNR